MQKQKKALITGITGQDGSFLAEFLLNKGYQVHGIVRRVALEDQRQRLSRIFHLLDRVTLHAASLESYGSLFQVVESIKPNECYHLAAQSYVSHSFQDQFSTFQANIEGTQFILAAIQLLVPDCHFYFAGSSEMFGKVQETPQKETTQFHPRSPYGISKVAGYYLTQYYREAYNLCACNGILFNHESERRGMEFVTRKISRTVAEIKLGLTSELRLGNVEALRDWGYAPEYVEAMWLMLQQDTPDDYVIATGESHSVLEFVQTAFEIVGLDWHQYVINDQAFYRPSDVQALVGDASKAKKKLSWQPRVTFRTLVEIMVKNDLASVQSKNPSTKRCINE